jgi:glycosyltransferase involved in cell wall biosynthesis
MKLKNGTFSIIIPVKAYNAYCEESLGTCRRLYPGQEILFSPDRPTRVKFPGVRVFPSGPVGPSVKRDLCMKAARGKYLAYLDDDAYPAAGWLEAAEEAFKDPEVGAVGGPAVTPPHDGLARWGSGLVYASLLAGGPYAYRYRPMEARWVDDYPTCNLVVRKSVMEAIGGFDTGYWPGEDTVACLKIVHELRKKIAYDPRVFVYHHRRDLYGPHLAQVRSYARHRGFFVKKFPRTSLRPSYFLPSLLVGGVFLGWIPALWFGAWWKVWAGGVSLYGLLACIDAFRAQRHAPVSLKGPRLAGLVAGGIIATHLVYGWNFLLGLTATSLDK